MEHNPVEFRHWQRKYKVYHEANNFETRPVSEQQGYFLNCIDSKLEQRIQDKASEKTPIYGNISEYCKKAEFELKPIYLDLA